MFKQLVIALFLSFFSLTSISVMAETASAKIKINNIATALNQENNKYIHTPSNDLENIQMDTDSNALKSQNAELKPRANNNEQSGWLLAFALFGFVMLSNRRGV